MSTGLVYPPGSYASTDELVYVGEPLRGGAGVYASHIRSEGFGLLEAIREAIDIGRRLETTVEVSHLKAAGLPNHGKSTEALAILDAARAEGLAVGNDAYPYLAGSTLLTQLLPPWVQDGGTDALVERLRSRAIRDRVTHDVRNGVPGWMSYSVHSGGFDKITISGVGTSALQHLEGRTIAEAATRAGKEPLELVYDTLVEDHGATVMIVTLMADQDVETILRHASTGIGSDQLGVTSPTARVHPRCYGTFARVLGWGVRERALATLPEAIRRMTSLGAETMGLRDRGRLAPDLQADVVIFDPSRIADTATYEEPTKLAVGVEAVVLRGGIAMDHGEVVDAHLGRVVRMGRRA
jgi:N-acyl-D-aspartate/D-glutamate deacylase